MPKQLQEQIAAIQAQQKKTSTALETAPIPESTSMATHRPPVFHGYDSEDVSRWLNKFESYLKLRRINPASPTALAELELNLAGPAEDFYYSLPADQRGYVIPREKDSPMIIKVGSLGRPFLLDSRDHLNRWMFT